MKPPHWIESGRGTHGLVFLHGVSGGAPGATDLLPRLTPPGWRGLAWDMPGYGASAAPDPFDFEALTQALLAMLDAAGNREPATDRAWAQALRRKHEERTAAADQSARKKTVGEDGRIHPAAIFAALKEVADPDLIRISERWESEEALGAHMASAHMAEFNKAMGTVKIEGADLWLYSAEAVKKLM